MVDGRIFWDATLPDVLRAERAADYDALNATIARLYTLHLRLAQFFDPRRFSQRATVATAIIAFEAIRRLIEPASVAGKTVMVIAAVGIEVDGLTALLFMRG